MPLKDLLLCGGVTHLLYISVYVGSSTNSSLFYMLLSPTLQHNYSLFTICKCFGISMTSVLQNSL